MTKLESMSDVELLHLLGLGDNEAFSLLYHKYDVVVYQFVKKILKSPELSEEVTQEILIKLRFFDLVRWGIAAETLNGYLSVEKVRHTYLASSAFTKGRDEYLPIPQTQINLTNGVYKQNVGY